MVMVFVYIYSRTYEDQVMAVGVAIVRVATVSVATVSVVLTAYYLLLTTHCLLLTTHYSLLTTRLVLLEVLHVTVVMHDVEERPVALRGVSGDPLGDLS